MTIQPTAKTKTNHYKSLLSSVMMLLKRESYQLSYISAHLILWSESKVSDTSGLKSTFEDIANSYSNPVTVKSVDYRIIYNYNSPD